MYHLINVSPPGTPSSERRLTVHPADFARQMRWLKQHGYRTVTQRELFEALRAGHGREDLERILREEELRRTA